MTFNLKVVTSVTSYSFRDINLNFIPNSKIEKKNAPN